MAKRGFLLRMTVEEWAQLERAAAQADLSVNRWAVDVLLAAARPEPPVPSPTTEAPRRMRAVPRVPPPPDPLPEEPPVARSRDRVVGAGLCSRHCKLKAKRGPECWAACEGEWAAWELAQEQVARAAGEPAGGSGEPAEGKVGGGEG